MKLIPAWLGRDCDSIGQDDEGDGATAQLITISHLPQIAARGDQQLFGVQG